MTKNGAQPDPDHTVFLPGPVPSNAPAADGEGRRTTETDEGGDDDDFPDPFARAPGHHALVAAAAPLLALAASMRSGRVQMNLAQFHHRAADAAERFDALITASGYDEETRRRARYAVFATVDDIAQNLPGHADDSREWARRSLVVLGFGESVGGDRFWQLLDDMLARPGGQAELIELYHACLAAGFEGRFRTGDADGRRRALYRSAYSALPHVQTLSQTELVPAWRGQPTARVKIGFWTPLALLGAGALGSLLLLGLMFRLVLIPTGEPAMQAMRELNPAAPLRLARSASPAMGPTETGQQKRIGRFLAEEIKRKWVVVEQDASAIRVRTTVGSLFRSGSDELVSGRGDLFERIAAAAEREKGAVRVEGHADSDPVSSLAFPDNVALSQARANKVAEIFRGRLSEPDRVRAEGFGDNRPIASNATAEAKALNRRVEIVIPRSE